MSVTIEVLPEERGAVSLQLLGAGVRMAIARRDGVPAWPVRVVHAGRIVTWWPSGEVTSDDET